MGRYTSEAQSILIVDGKNIKKICALVNIILNISNKRGINMGRILSFLRVLKKL